MSRRCFLLMVQKQLEQKRVAVVSPDCNDVVETAHPNARNSNKALNRNKLLINCIFPVLQVMFLVIYSAYPVFAAYSAYSAYSA